MLGDFSYSNPTKLYFGEHSLEGLRKELPAYGKNVLLVYGGGSIKRTGLYDQVVSILKESGKQIAFIDGYRNGKIVEKLGIAKLPTIVEMKKGTMVRSAEPTTVEDIKKFIA